MRNFILFLLGCVALISLTSCNSNKNSENISDYQASQAGEEKENVQRYESGELTLLYDGSSSFSNHFGTENGFYYFTEYHDIDKNLSGRHLMYIDYATKKEVYLCSNSSCRHNSDRCSSVFMQSEYGDDCIPFVWNNNLYILSREYDDDGSTSINLGGDYEAPPSPSTTLYKMNLDGSSREKVYTFGDDVTTEKLVFGDGDNLWFVTKKLVVQTEKSTSYTTSTDRCLSRYNISNRKIEETISLDFGDNVHYSVAGGSGKNIVLTGVAYPNGMSETDIMKLSDDDWRTIIKKSSTIFVSYNIETKEKVSLFNESTNSTRNTYSVHGEYLYMSACDGGNIYKINLASGEKKILATLKQNYIYYTTKNMLCCVSTGTEDDSTYYFVDMETGEIHHSTLTNKSLGWQLDILAHTQDKVLVIYDYEATKNNDSSYCITKYKYALIDAEDLYNSKASYEPIDMIGGGK